ncbi:MAG: tetratricopeptide repeat protein [Gammaproteobacteria bacterium]|nr:tetratricopeptide repeat protein [Gammaproteobacteria bacterium]MCP5137813.1 tetratricopeptide repeat protein [Gammaproteobacteria bacterium]
MLFRQALALKSTSPELADIHVNNGRAAMQLGRYDEAGRSFRSAISLRPEWADARRHYGRLLTELGRYGEARTELSRAVALGDGDSDARALLGVAHARSGDFDGAITAYREAMHLNPNNTRALAYLVGLLWRLDHKAEALALYQLGLRDHPRAPMLHLGLGDILIASGQTERGWQEHQWVYHPDADAPPVTAFGEVLPQWDGTDPQGRTLLVYADQGAGDAIQFLRFVPLLAQRVHARIVVWLPAAFRNLFETLPGVAEWRSSGAFREASTGCWAITPLGGLPARLGLTSADSTAMYPELVVPATRYADWNAWIDTKRDSAFAVGFVWHGNIRHGGDVFRSIPVAQLAPLADVKGVTWVSLQKADARRPRTEAKLPFTALDAAPGLVDWAETAAVLRNLDLLITVDTGVAHLAGALGVRTWLLLARIPDSRWMLEGASTPWYPSMRLFRQPAVGDWGAVIERVRNELRGGSGWRRRKCRPV